MESLSQIEARRLALARAGLLNPEWTHLPGRGQGKGLRARKAALRVVRRFGYLQLDTIAVAGARSQTLVLLSRLEGLDPQLCEALLAPGEPLFEYWGHEASWIPMELYPAFEFRRIEFRHHPWWGDVLGEHPKVADRLLRRIRLEGPLRTVELEDPDSAATTRQPSAWPTPRIVKKVASALWSRGDLAIRERRGFQRTYDLAERVIPDEFRQGPPDLPGAFRTLLLRALAGHGWARTGTLADTWRLRNLRGEIDTALAELTEEGEIIPCSLASGPRASSRSQRASIGWIRPADLELARRLRRARPRRDRGVLLSPFDPVLWDRARVRTLFDFEQILEIFKPKSQRVYGYYCLPVLAGDRLVGRLDLRADRRAGRLEVLAHHEEGSSSAADREATRSALERHARTLGLIVATREHQA